MCAVNNGIEVFEELDRIEVFISAVFVGQPLAVLLAVVEIQHGGDCVNTDAVDVELLDPVENVCDQEVTDLMLAEIENTGTPVGMFAAAGIRIFKDALTVESCKTVCIRAEVRGHPVQDNADSGIVQLVDHIHEVIGCSVARCRRIVTRDLISPGAVEGVLGNADQLDMGIAELLQILYDAVSEFSVVIEPVSAVRMFHPRTDMALVDRQRLLIGVLFAALVHPARIRPAETGDIRGFGCSTGPEFRRICKGIGLIDFAAVLGSNAVLIQFSRTDSGDEQRPDTAVIELLHGIFFFVPVIECTNHRDRFGIRCPDSKEKSFFSILFGRMSAKLPVNVIMRSVSEKIRICLRYKNPVARRFCSHKFPFLFLLLVFSVSCCFPRKSHGRSRSIVQ